MRMIKYKKPKIATLNNFVQNNFVQLNNIKLSQNRIAQLSSEKLNEIESIIKDVILEKEAGE